MKLIYRGVAHDRRDSPLPPALAHGDRSPVVATGVYRGCPIAFRALPPLPAWLRAVWPVPLRYRGLPYGAVSDRPDRLAEPTDSANRAVNRLAQTVARDRQITPSPVRPPLGPLPDRSTLYPSQRGDRVIQLQTALVRGGWLGGPYQAGYYGPLTDRAVRKLQHQWGQPATGIADARVWRWVETQGDRPTPVPRPVPCSPIARSLLQLGDRGPLVAELQARLRCRGWFDQRITGHFDPATAAAVGRFQADRSLPVTGIADQATLAALVDRSGRSTPGSGPADVQLRLSSIG
ncbi:MAG: hypothetical protein EA001_08705 [Oscillatoriales cyanobacterium]|nr:MAG: hypothetical protein EA001_08705 [Oscillatoriales cyanobacterium]